MLVEEERKRKRTACWLSASLLLLATDTHTQTDTERSLLLGRTRVCRVPCRRLLFSLIDCNYFFLFFHNTHTGQMRAREGKRLLLLLNLSVVECKIK